jgi:malate dehydrogenase (oxaloacetate-decarboxylating)(NADP+)
MFACAAQAVAEQVSQEQLDSGLIYPPQSRILEASLHVATRVAQLVFDRGLARMPRPDDVAAHVRSVAFAPVYANYV